MLSILEGLPVVLVAMLSAALVTAEAGLLVGVFLPGGSALLVLGASSVPILVAIPMATVATLLGGWYGLHRGRRWTDAPPTEHLDRNRATQFLGRLLDRATRPGVGTFRAGLFGGLGQGFAGSRTLVPRLLGARGVRHRQWLWGAAPAALIWSIVMVNAGDLGASALAALDPSPVLLLVVLSTAVLLTAARILRRRWRACAV